MYTVDEASLPEVAAGIDTITVDGQQRQNKHHTDELSSVHVLTDISNSWARRDGS